MSLEKIFYFSIFIFYLLFLKNIFSFSKNNSYFLFLFLFSKNIFILFYLKKKKHLIKKNKNYF